VFYLGFRLRIISAFACFSALLTAVLSRGQQSVEPWKVPHLSLAAKDIYAAATAVAAPEGTNVVLLEDDESYTFDDAGRLTHVGYFVYKVLTQKGAEGWDAFSVGWQPWHQARPEIRVRVISSDLAEHLLDPRTITEAPALEGEYKLYSDAKRLRAPFPAVAPGAVIEEEFIERETDPVFTAGRVGWTFFGRERVPVEHSHVEFDTPASLPLRTGTRLLPDVKPVREESNGRVKLTFDIGRLEAIEPRDPNLPSDEPTYPQLSYSTGASWQAVAAAYAKIVDEHADASAVQESVNKLIAGKVSVSEKEAAIIDYIGREVRYTGIEFGGAAIIPHNPSDTLGQKYGDCKDKATLLVTMFRAAGIPAYVALLNAGSNMDVPQDLPGMGLFDHAIVYVPGAPVSKKSKTAAPDLWIDATDRYARLGQLPIADQGRLALIARPETTALVNIPESSSKDNVLLEQREIKLSENGPATITETTRPSGVYESRYRFYYADQPDKEMRDNLKAYIKAQYLSQDLGTVERTDPADLSRPFELTITCEKARRGYTDLSNAVAAIRLEAMFFRLPDELRRKDDPDEKKKQDQDKDQANKPRTEDWQLIEPYTEDWTYRIIPPPGFVPKELPRGTNISLGPAQITEKFSTEKDGVVLAHLTFDTAKRRYTIAEATELRNKVADIIAGPAVMINFEPEAEVLLREGKVREALASYRSLVAKHPTEAVHHLQVAKVLLDAGMGEAARTEAREAVKLEPNSALAEKMLAQILRYDLVGRNMRPGSDLAGAAEAYRAATRLDPDDHETQGDLAILLEYDPVGRRYSPQSRLSEAIAEYEGLGQDNLNALSLSNNLAFAKFYGGDFGGACKTGQALNPEPKALLAACVGAQQGSKAGLAEANKQAANDNNRKEIAHTAGEMLMNVRNYPVAADFLEAGASGDSAAQSMGLASMLHGAQHHEDLKFDNTPADLVKHFFLVSMDPDLSESKMRPLLSRSALKVLDNMDADEKKKEMESGRQLNSQLARQGSFLDVTLDILAEAFTPKGDGSDAVGYREKVQVPGGASMTMFVVKEDGQYKLLDTVEKPNSIGLEILDRVTAGDLKGAKQLLDWLREDAHLEGGDDPLGGPVFPRFWTRGAAPDARRMKLAAAAILIGTRPTVAQGVPILKEGRKSAASDQEKTNILLALSSGYSMQQNFSGLLDVASALLKQAPESRYAFAANIEALIGLKRYDDAMAISDERLKALENDADALQAKMRVESSRGNYSAAQQWVQKLADQGNDNADLLNSTAWFALFTGKVQDSDISNAIKSTQLAKDNPHILHTLACLYAETGRTKEARELLLRAMDEQNLDEPNDDFWYAFGRIAEQYGEREMAIADYRKVEKPKFALEVPTSSYTLAQMRLKVLGVAGIDQGAAGK
jgi:tetratricopeptide (TPR) repeat protein/transglutaminase-like putative cysteine protease